MRWKQEDDGYSYLIRDLKTDNYDVVAEIPKTGDEQYDASVVAGYADLIEAAPELLKQLWIAYTYINRDWPGAVDAAKNISELLARLEKYDDDASPETQTEEKPRPETP